MAEPITPWPDIAAQPLTSEPPALAQPLEPLEGRVQRLEAAVAALQDTQALEERIVERIKSRIQSTVAAEAERVAAADRQTSAVSMMAAAEQALRTAAAPVAQPLTRGTPWLALDLYLDFFAIFRMFFDLKYKVGWTTRILVFVLLPAILTSHWWLPFAHIVVVGEVFDKLVDLLLAFVMFKALSREARRYLETRGLQ